LASSRAGVIALLLLAVALGFGISMRAVLIDVRTNQTHDEAISYLAASGNQLAFHERVYLAPKHRWQPAAALQSFTQPDDGFVFGRIREGLARTDVHPPLYFWLLHGWLLVLGSGIHTGPQLNLLLFALTALTLFFVARRWLRNDVEATAVVLLYAVSSRACQASMEARPYELYALAVACLALSLTVLSDPTNSHRIRAGVWVALALLGGMLTHYQFALVAAGGVLIAGVYLLRDRDTRLVSLLAAVVASAAAWLALTPHFVDSVARYRAQGDSIDPGPLTGYIGRVWASLAGFLANDPLWPLPAAVHARVDAMPAWVFVFPVVMLVVVCLIVEIASRRFRRKPFLVQQPRTEGVIHALCLLLTTIVAVYGMYLLRTRALSSIDPPRYNLIVGMGLAFVPVIAIRFLRPLPAVAAISVLILYMGASTIHDATRPQPATWEPPAILREAPRVLIGTVDRGVLPPILHHVEPDARVFAAPLTALAEHARDWLDDLEPGDAFVAHISYGNTMKDYERVLALVRERFLVEGEWAFSQGYLVHRLHDLESGWNPRELPWQQFMSNS